MLSSMTRPRRNTIEIVNVKKLKHWLNVGLIKAIKTKDNIYKKVKCNPDNSGLKNNFKTLMKNRHTWIRDAKWKYFTNIFKSRHYEIGKQWIIINLLSG